VVSVTGPTRLQCCDMMAAGGLAGDGFLFFLNSVSFSCVAAAVLGLSSGNHQRFQRNFEANVYSEVSGAAESRSATATTR
jgi:hypothetical protein